MRRGRVLIASLALVWAGGLAACGADGAAPTPSTESPGQTSPVTSSPAKTIPVIGGGNFDTAAFGTGPLALWFWAPG